MIRKKFSLVLGLLSVFVWLSVFMPAPVQAQACGPTGGSFLGFPTWYKYLNYDAGTCELNVNIPGDIVLILLAVFEILLRIAGMLAVIFIIYGGFLYLTSAGEPDKAKNGRTTIINALVGLVLAMSATVIVSIIGRAL